jgi:hypothetical protein
MKLTTLQKRPVLMGTFGLPDSTGDDLAKKMRKKRKKGPSHVPARRSFGALLHDFDRQNVILLTARRESSPQRLNRLLKNSVLYQGTTLVGP